MRMVWIFLLGFAVILIGCQRNPRNGPVQTLPPGGPRSSKPQFPTKAPIPPGKCRVIGQIIRIDTARKSARPQAPCGKEPCWAQVKIVQILGYGAGFTTPLGVNRVVPVYFRAGLKGKIRSADKQTSVRILTTGSIFQADLEIEERPSGQKSQFVAGNVQIIPQNRMPPK